MQTENNNIVVNDEMQTSIENIYAYGDCTGEYFKYLRLYEGTKAGLAIINKLRRRKIRYE
ncbi:MAG: FAD-dependent oxidoreductase [Clostridia bacterium]